jgi:DNA-directed RNA polymerase specialized sigma24 family protein
MRQNRDDRPLETQIALDDRMLRLTWSVSRACTRTRRSARRQTRRLLAGLDWEQRANDPSGAGMRQQVLEALAAHWQRRRPRRFSRSVSMALLVDAFLVLPAQQRWMVEQAMVRRRNVTDIAAEAGVGSGEVVRALREALRTLTGAGRDRVAVEVSPERR